MVLSMFIKGQAGPRQAGSEQRDKKSLGADCEGMGSPRGHDRDIWRLIESLDTLWAGKGAKKHRAG